MSTSLGSHYSAELILVLPEFALYQGNYTIVSENQVWELLMAECLCLNHALPEPPNLCVEGLTPSVSFFYYYLLGYNCFTVPC